MRLADFRISPRMCSAPHSSSAIVSRNYCRAMISLNSITATFTETSTRENFGESRGSEPRSNNVTGKFRAFKHF